MIQKSACLKSRGGVNCIKSRFFIQVCDINNDFIVKINIFFQYKLKTLGSFVFNLVVVIEPIDHFDGFMLNILASLD